MMEIEDLMYILIKRLGTSAVENINKNNNGLFWQRNPNSVSTYQLFPVLSSSVDEVRSVVVLRHLSCHNVCITKCETYTNTCYQVTEATCSGHVTTTELHLLRRKTVSSGWKLWKRLVSASWVEVFFVFFLSNYCLTFIHKLFSFG